MDSRTWNTTLGFLLILCILTPKSTIIAEASSVFFLDSSSHHYLRSPSDRNALSETDTLSAPEVAAAISVLVGSAPPSTLSAASSLKLNKVLMPNPFDRPVAVLALEVRGLEDSQHLVNLDKSPFSNALRSKLMVGETKVDIQLQEEDEVSVISLNNLPTSDSDSKCTEKELADFAYSLGGSYAADDLPLNGEFSIPLASGAHIRLDLSKKVDKEFITSLVSLIRNIERVMELHQAMAGSEQTFTELITGTFDGVKALQEHYGTEGVAELGLELFIVSISKMFDSLQEAYKGKIMGVILHNAITASESKELLNVMISSRPSARWLAETERSPNSTAIAEAVLVRLTVAWTTGLVLIIATLLGIYFLLNMPLTRDTLLYSNVKLD